MITATQSQVIGQCRKSVVWFLKHFGRLKHPSAGILPFDPFHYQISALQSFRKNRFNIFKKCRQCFVGDTPIWGPHGQTKLQNMRPCDPVYTQNTITKEIDVSWVEELYDNGIRDCITLETALGSQVTVTADHNFFTNQGPTEAGKLTPDHKIFRFDSEQGEHFANAIDQVVRVRDAGPQKVYDIRVPPYDNYFADGLLVHNSGISKISGAFALWFAMFNNNKTVLIVSRKDDDAMGFLRDQVVFLFDHLPKWMRELWKPIKQNEHEIIFPNNSRIQSLTSNPDVLRSQASSLNIIDEAAFIQGMGEMWAAGLPTLIHGGSAIVISTTCGLGNWYWSTWTDAEAGLNEFNPIVINWWDMDWVIEYVDPLTLKKNRIAPKDGIRPCTTKEEIDKYGPYWSPWLEEQWRALQERGEGWKFDQEVLASFVGSGNTVLAKSVLTHISTTLNDDWKKVAGIQSYVHPITGEVSELDFTFQDLNEGLWVWVEPVLGTPTRKRGNLIIDPGSPAHTYVMGVDTATGKSKDYHAIEIFDINMMEQVAEMMCRCLPMDLVRYVDRIGRWYNCALTVVERNNGGDTIIDELRHKYQYPRLYRKKDINDKPRNMKSKSQRPLKVSPYGFMTGQASKATLNKFLMDYLRDTNGAGYTIYSRRLLKQLNTYVRKKDKSGRDTGKTEAEEGGGNFDDLVMATGLALIGAGDALFIDNSTLAPVGGGQNYKSNIGPVILSDEQRAGAMRDQLSRGGTHMLMPMSMAPDDVPEISAMRALDAFTYQLGAVPMSGGKPIVSPPRWFFDKKK